MKKVVCARCELVNLDTFPAFPFCEACGARLPSLRRFGWRGPLRRPPLALVWAVVLGGALGMLALLSVGLARDTRAVERGSLAIQSQSAPDPHDGHAQIWTLNIRPAQAGDDESLRHLELRLNREDEKRWHVSVLSPRPDSVQSRGSGRYFGWSLAQRTAKIQLRLASPTLAQAKTAPLRLWWKADGFEALGVEVRAWDSAASWNKVVKSFTLRP